MKIRKNGKTVNLTESDIKKIIVNPKEESIKVKKGGEVVELNETEIKQIVNKHKINNFLSEQVTRSMRDEIHDLMKAYERIINSKVGGSIPTGTNQPQIHWRGSVQNVEIKTSTMGL